MNFGLQYFKKSNTIQNKPEFRDWNNRNSSRPNWNQTKTKRGSKCTKLSTEMAKTERNLKHRFYNCNCDCKEEQKLGVNHECVIIMKIWKWFSGLRETDLT